MSIFTATVPTFSEEDERKELAALGEEERKRLHAEICGATRITTPTTPSASVHVESAEVLMREAVESLSARDKAAYVEAMKRVPKLVERESSFLAFLECEAWNPWAAAARLARYWTFRKRTFGNELAFLPMTQKGAMRQDIELLERQAFVLPLESDSGGRPVVVWDRIRASPEARSGVMRCLFYVTSKMGLHEGFSSNGFVVLLNYQGCNLKKHYDRAVTKQVTALLQAIPGKMKAAHFCTGPGRSVTGLLLPVLKQIVGKEFRLRFLVQAGSKGDVSARLPDYGMNEGHVNALYGPIADRAALARKWVLEHRRLEQAS